MFPSEKNAALKIAAAQSTSIAGDIQANVQRHVQFMQAAIEQGVQFLMFPELSLSGYESSLARAVAIDSDDARLLPLRELAAQSGMITVVGGPLKTADDRILIGALIIDGAGRISVYTKQHLHPGEELTYTPGQGGPLLALGDERLAMAVCADFSEPDHARRAAVAGADFYMASVLVSKGGYATDSRILRGYAAEHGMAVLMANHGGATGGWVSAGRSAFWAQDGTQVGAANGPGDLLLIVERDAQGWSARTVELVL
ncbi:carbon-nitrogen hydrolase family protein [Pseudomonas sp. Pseusp122]|uniref:carbon-nitrogen hydrolase family protein n=1 Tax=unclassified Pseudomonas TaxID=196821 RepID=UPI0039A67E3E